MHMSLSCSDAATEIKRVVRGHVGRRQAQLRLQEVRDSRQRSLFDYFTIQLQRCFRGYYSRKYKKDHSARRAYFKKVAEKNQEVLEMMSEYALVQVSVSISFAPMMQIGHIWSFSYSVFSIKQANQRAIQEEKERQFNVCAENMHHLVSTKNIPGVYKPGQRNLQVLM